jgi:ATP-dependent DNA helicase
MALPRDEPHKSAKSAPSVPRKQKASQKGRKNTAPKGGRKRRRIQRRPRDSDDEDDEMLGEEESRHDEATLGDDDKSEANPVDDDLAEQFPVVITTYEMIVKDRVYLSAYDFSYIGSRYTLVQSLISSLCEPVVDEGHRLKNYSSRLMQEIKKYKSAGRMLLTGTPLHVGASP